MGKDKNEYLSSQAADTDAEESHRNWLMDDDSVVVVRVVRCKLTVSRTKVGIGILATSAVITFRKGKEWCPIIGRRSERLMEMVFQEFATSPTTNDGWAVWYWFRMMTTTNDDDDDDEQ